MSRRQLTARIAGLSIATSLALTAGGVKAADLIEPPVFASRNGVLDILMIAKPSATSQFGLGAPLGWIYEICERPSDTATRCPPGVATSTAYGGTRLALKPGDKLKVRLVNQLPAYAPGEAKHALETGRGDLALNPTNIHTHGLIVEPRRPTVARPTWGDNIFVLAYNDKNDMPQPALTGSHVHGPVTAKPVDYDIDIPLTHPSGAYWFHPHAHGIALNQVSAGLAGIISIGSAGDYACEDAACKTRWSEHNVRHLVLKDMQVDQYATAPKTLTQEYPQFCAPTPVVGEELRQGHCAGQFGDPTDPTTDHSLGRWYFSVNGQAYPKIHVRAPGGEIWRLTNASGSNSYDLHLFNDAAGKDMVMQVLSVDGVSISASDAVTTGQMAQIGGAKLRVVNCPAPTVVPGPQAAPPVCVTGAVMMPSSRLELWVTYRDDKGNIAVPAPGARATFKTVGYQTGPAGDSWPTVDLADVSFEQGARPAGSANFVTVRGHARTALGPGGIFASQVRNGPASATPLPPNCNPLPPGHHRRIYYGVPSTNANAFGLAYEEIDAAGNVVGASATDVAQFDPATATICLPLAAGNMPVKEVWELVNLAGEHHNFHIHQTKFRVVDNAAPAGSALFTQTSMSSVPQLPFPPGTLLHDNIPLLAGQALDDTGCAGVAEWKGGHCQPTTVTVEIAFSQIGDFVYHCHILEHEDGGMMAKITVTGAP